MRRSPMLSVSGWPDPGCHRGCADYVGPFADSDLPAVSRLGNGSDRPDHGSEISLLLINFA